MVVRYLHRFDRSFAGLTDKEQEAVIVAADRLIDFLREPSKPPPGLGLKKLAGNLWEVRVGIRLRIAFAFSEGTVTFVLVGSHDQVRRFVRSL